MAPNTCHCEPGWGGSNCSSGKSSSCCCLWAVTSLWVWLWFSVKALKRKNRLLYRLTGWATAQQTNALFSWLAFFMFVRHYHCPTLNHKMLLIPCLTSLHFCVCTKYINMLKANCPEHPFDPRSSCHSVLSSLWSGWAQQTCTWGWYYSPIELVSTEAYLHVCPSWRH